MTFNPQLCRNESEVESKLIVNYLLPKLGYTPDTWHQEVAFGRIRLDFLAFAIQKIPFVLDADSPLGVVMEAKHPQQKLDKHIPRLKRYLISLNLRYALLTNAKEIRIYERFNDDIQLIYQCSGEALDSHIDEIKSLIGRGSLKEKPTEVPSVIIKSQDEQIKPTVQISKPNLETRRKDTMKAIAVYHNKGGVGKTTTVVNLAAALSKKGKRVLVIDMDSQANTTFATGLIKFDDEEMDDIKDCNILHVLRSEELYPIQQVAKKSQFTNPEISVVPSHISLMNEEHLLTQIDYCKWMLGQKLEAVKELYDIVIIDTPPSLNLYARIALITADYLIIPSDLKPFANQGLVNVKDLVKKVDVFRKQIGKPTLEIIGVVACKISTNSKFIQHTLKNRLEKIDKKYGIPVLDTVIYERDDLAKCAERVMIVGDLEIPDPISVLDFKPDSVASQEFELLAMEVLEKIGMN
ncbi:AAA family ATPase [Floridanema aerugineum]|uniref:AAA family ATPase n=1 Tax=Floridaenema aerugineum BLCC-F46 TaxID=3153654 RepID=A0ABV4XBL5_9CYAN